MTTKKQVEKFINERLENEDNLVYEAAEAEAGSQLSEEEKKVAKATGVGFQEYLKRKNEVYTSSEEIAKKQEEVKEKLLHPYGNQE